jgi:hypothetical protein
MYQYKHENGKVINKSDYVVDYIGAWSYFNSPFVIAWWHINDKTAKADIHENDYLKYRENKRLPFTRIYD